MSGEKDRVGWKAAGSVPPIYTKSATLYYSDVVVGALRQRSCARRKALGEEEFSRCARGFLVIAFNARSGPLPLPPVCVRVGWLMGADGGRWGCFFLAFGAWLGWVCCGVFC